MKKLLLTSGVVFCLSVAALAQEPARAATKKSAALKTSLAPQTKSKDESAARLKEKQKHYEALKAGAPTTAPADNKTNAARGSRKTKIK
ncbi:MAG: hypothetical protein EOP51_22000 [Sphingobacteriales bacterium]|nr:MAG: hypothetical protein EOP51_22000 [Sphingobacteriales bacterium]